MGLHMTGQMGRAASAALMIELCKADRSTDEIEINTIVGILRNRFALEQAELDELVALAERMDQTQKRAAMKRAISFRPLSGPTTATDSSGAD